MYFREIDLPLLPKLCYTTNFDNVDIGISLNLNKHIQNKCQRTSGHQSVVQYNYSSITYNVLAR